MTQAVDDGHTLPLRSRNASFLHSFQHTEYVILKKNGNTTASTQQYKIQHEDEELRPFLLSPHRQTLTDMEYFVKDLKDANHEVLIFMDANENETHRFQAQTHDVKSVTKHGFHVDGSIDGSLHTSMRNCGLLNVIKELNEGATTN
jgi:hypothetical protein